MLQELISQKVGSRAMHGSSEPGPARWTGMLRGRKLRLTGSEKRVFLCYDHSGRVWKSETIVSWASHRADEFKPRDIWKARSIMPSGEVHWHEGMFLRPHHFLTEHRRTLRLMQLDGKWGLHHNWGLRAISLNTEALSNHRFSVSSLRPGCVTARWLRFLRMDRWQTSISSRPSSGIAR